jgi:hypothetical protein
LTSASAANVGLHLLGLVLAVLALRPGSPLVPLDARVSYLAGHPVGWSLGWGVWMLCALALVAYLAALREHATLPALASLAVTLGAAGAAIDLACDVGQIVVLPDLAGRPPAEATFVTWERWLGATGAIVANGLYSLAVPLASFALRGRMPTYVQALALATGVAGLLMVAAGFSGNPHHLEASVGPTIASFLLWTIAGTWVLRQEPSEPRA